MKKLLYLIILILCTYAGYWFGKQTWIFDTDNKPHHFNTEEARLMEVQYGNALFEALHWYYVNDKDKWNNEFKLTKEYDKIDSLNGGDWEDFFAPSWK